MGFTLIELMIALVVLTILTVVAMGSYSSYTLKSNRAAGKAMMLQVAQSEERYYTENNTYVTTAGLGLGNPINSARNAYSITVAAGGQGIQNSYVITGVPAKPDSKCGTLTLDNLGNWTNSQGAPAANC